uniref:Methyltransferase n=1 Tax=Helianthus annuus TaxID=4232 RepID=A0A251UGQ8_HELAN
MDMKENLGSFLWVMNVAIDSIHNWCEAYSTYPRTYDLLHASNVFSYIIERKGCSGEDLLI